MSSWSSSKSEVTSLCSASSLEYFCSSSVSLAPFSMILYYLSPDIRELSFQPVDLAVEHLVLLFFVVHELPHLLVCLPVGFQKFSLEEGIVALVADLHKIICILWILPLPLECRLVGRLATKRTTEIILPVGESVFLAGDVAAVVFPVLRRIAEFVEDGQAWSGDVTLEFHLFRVDVLHHFVLRLLQLRVQL